MTVSSGTTRSPPPTTRSRSATRRPWTARSTRSRWATRSTTTSTRARPTSTRARSSTSTRSPTPTKPTRTGPTGEEFDYDEFDDDEVDDDGIGAGRVVTDDWGGGESDEPDRRDATRAYPAIGALPDDAWSEDEPAYRRPPSGPPGPPRPPSKVPRAVVLKHRARRRRFIIGLTFFLSVTVTLMGTGYVYLQYRIGQIPRVDIPSLVGDDPNGVMNVLLVGSDSRANLEGELAIQAGTPRGQRSDTIMVLHIDQKQEKAAILSIPRDLYLPIAGEDYSDRVNAAFSLGGPEGLSETIQEALGITINHYVEVDFVGFKDIVDAVGGVELYLPAWARDFTSGLDLPYMGCVNVNGTQGLAWVRSREFEYLVDGAWIPDPRGDLGRIERQQDFIRRMLKRALSSGLTNPLQLNRLIGIGVRDVTLDETLSTKDITTLARRFNDLDPDSVQLLTLPTTPADIDGKSVLELREEEAKPFLDRINGLDGSAGATPAGPGETTTTLPAELLLFPADIDIRVLNGEGTPGTAARSATALQEVGFTVSGTGDATEIGRTTIRYGPDSEAAAQLLDQALVGGADLIVDETVTATDLVLVLGADYQGVKPGPVTPVPRPSTTVTTEVDETEVDETGADETGADETGADGTESTTSTLVTPSTAPPTTAGPPTLPPGVEC